jgi:hypothetical protein
MNIGICTSFYNGYDKFLPRWAKSIAALKTKPKFVSVYASGPYDHKNTKEAMDILQRAGIQFIFDFSVYHSSMGRARNAAVENCNSRWIMYLDVDDTILPDAIDIIAKYENKACVICTGLKVAGKKKKFIYTNTTRKSILSGKHGSSSHSVYKKNLWHKAPYIETNDYIEQPFWLGLAQARASFIGTKEICTIYHSRSDGHNRSMTQEQKKEARAQFKRFIQEGVHK